ncbi:threonine/homoserine/homoserine lactone efflux protein [Sinobacterium caligoides]|uniref:Threonine/homoserine/homoserine lactone efflux protein n=1 Tax=Sinobacterium caligoides TaxID=933926 RepID=A0A3N2E0E7_9GAMM|nr:LysE family translocator [Sinobacterium caligoides]ROS05564.1 threonine/homoserine/homoserine lactone efflux protein [Sinobacterium caligoides]
MSTEIWGYYVVAILVLTAMPGPSIFLCVSKSVVEGFAAAVLTAMGSLTAIVVILTLSFTGLGVVIASSELAFSIIKWLGAAYLIYLGVRALASKESSFSIDTPAHSTRSDNLSNFSAGFIVGISNPKAIVFFTALFPQFINTSEPLLFQYLVFVSTFAILETLWLLAYAYLGLRSRHWLSTRGRARLFNKLTGGVFIGAAVMLSGSNRAGG